MIFKNDGYIEVFCGPMSSGKSEQLIQKINKCDFAKIKYLVFKPSIDTRVKAAVKSRNGLSIPAINVRMSQEIIKYIKKNKTTKVIFIDEAQFFDGKLPYLCYELAAKGYTVYVGGLDTDFRGEPWPIMSKILSFADKINKLTAICSICHKEACMTQRLIKGKPAKYTDPIILIDDKSFHCPRCRKHHKVLNNPNKIKL